MRKPDFFELKLLIAPEEEVGHLPLVWGETAHSLINTNRSVRTYLGQEGGGFVFTMIWPVEEKLPLIMALLNESGAFEITKQELGYKKVMYDLHLLLFIVAVYNQPIDPANLDEVFRQLTYFARDIDEIASYDPNHYEF